MDKKKEQAYRDAVKSESGEMSRGQLEFSEALGALIRAANRKGDLGWGEIVVVVGSNLLGLYEFADKHGYLDRELAARGLRDMADYVEQGIFSPPDIQ